MIIRDITIVRREHHPEEVSLRTSLPGPSADEPELHLNFKWPGKSLEYVQKHFPKIPITIINAIDGSVTEIDAKGKQVTKKISKWVAEGDEERRC